MPAMTRPPYNAYHQALSVAFWVVMPASKSSTSIGAHQQHHAGDDDAGTSERGEHGEQAHGEVGDDAEPGERDADRDPGQDEHP